MNIVLIGEFRLPWSKQAQGRQDSECSQASAISSWRVSRFSIVSESAAGAAVKYPVLLINLCEARVSLDMSLVTILASLAHDEHKRES